MNDEKDTSFGHQAAYDILYRFYVVLKIAKIHDSNNANFQDQIKALISALNAPSTARAEFSSRSGGTRSSSTSTGSASIIPIFTSISLCWRNLAAGRSEP
ncbi:MAG: hypothetical protein M0C28_08035 [Candidatus Moduliflexus flocculans]|nr:hypothetical protein [Candidatus Moduliflexus flocculans]